MGCFLRKTGRNLEQLSIIFAGQNHVGYPNFILMKDQLLESDIPEKDLTRVIEALEKAGFKDFKAFIQDENEWICVTARKA